MAFLVAHAVHALFRVGRRGFIKNLLLVGGQTVVKRLGTGHAFLHVFVFDSSHALHLFQPFRCGHVCHGCARGPCRVLGPCHGLLVLGPGTVLRFLQIELGFQVQ